jgi:hypothetical protein
MPKEMFFNQSPVSQINKKTDIPACFLREGGNVIAIKYTKDQKFINSGTIRIRYVPKSYLPRSRG